MSSLQLDAVPVSPAQNSEQMCTIFNRCRDDATTKLRLKYNPWYHTIEKQMGSRVIVDGREMIMLSSNDYLGLTNHPKVLEAGKKALERWGSSTTGSRLANGSRRHPTHLVGSKCRENEMSQLSKILQFYTIFRHLKQLVFPADYFVITFLLF